MSERPRLRVVQGGRDQPSRAEPVEVDASFVGERVVGAVVDAAARPAPRALTAGAASPAHAPAP